MTFIDLIFCWPTPINFIVGTLFGIFVIQMFLLPFRINKIKEQQREQNEILRELLKETRLNKQTFNDTQAVLRLLLGEIGSKEKSKKKS